MFNSFSLFLNSLFIISYILLFVKYFFKFFKNFLLDRKPLLKIFIQQLLYYIISLNFCQELFNFSFRSDLYCSDRSPSATFIDYHIWSLVSRSFFILFRSQISSDVIFSCRSFSDVDYLTIAVYSISTAFCLFFIFIKTNFIPYIFLYFHAIILYENLRWF